MVRLKPVERDAWTREGAPACAFTKWADAWRGQDWEAMYSLSQLHWQASAPKAARIQQLRKKYAGIVPMHVVDIAKNTPKGYNRDVLSDQYVVMDIQLPAYEPVVRRMLVVARVLREAPGDRRKWWKRWPMRAWCFVRRKHYVPVPCPDPDGTWGVNPISVKLQPVGVKGGG